MSITGTEILLAIFTEVDLVPKNSNAAIQEGSPEATPEATCRGSAELINPRVRGVIVAHNWQIGCALLVCVAGEAPPERKAPNTQATCTQCRVCNYASDSIIRALYTVGSFPHNQAQYRNL